MNYQIVQLSNENRLKYMNSKKRVEEKWNRPKRMYKKCVDVETGRLKRKFGYDLDMTKPLSESLRWCC